MSTTLINKQEMLDELHMLVIAHFEFMGDVYGYQARDRLIGAAQRPSQMYVEEDDLSGSKNYPITRIFEQLYDFAINAEWDSFGDLLDPDIFLDSASGYVELTNVFMLALGEADDAPSCRQVVEMAVARNKMDKGEALQYSDLALLANMTVSAVKNAATPKAGSGRLQVSHINEDGKTYSFIEVESAKPWLADRRAYKKTQYKDSIELIDALKFTNIDAFIDWLKHELAVLNITHEQFEQHTGIEFKELEQPNGWSFIFEGATFDIHKWAAAAKLINREPLWLFSRVLKVFGINGEILRDIIFFAQEHYSVPMTLVPVAADGTPFLPGLKGRKGYYVGKKGNEVCIPDYQDALEHLGSMPIPYWRRPNKTTGRAGIVKGVGWKEIPTNEIEPS